MIDIRINGIEPNKDYDEVVKSAKMPDFASYQEDLIALNSLIEKYQSYPKFIVIGNGGSITTFQIYVRALKGNGKKVFILNTNEPDLIKNLKKEYTPVDTVIVCVSKSGATVANIETMLQFSDYKAIIVTEKDTSPLAQIAKYYHWTIVPHPTIGGRFSGFTSSAFVPASLFGFPLDRLQNSALEMYKMCLNTNDPGNNPAWQIASSLYRLGLVGKDEIFMPLYSYYLETSTTFLMQIVHESLGKDGKGWTIIPTVAPESQHHTNQRFFGGKKNMVGVFVSVKEQRDLETKTNLVEALKDIPIRDGSLVSIDDVTLSDALRFEYEGTKKHAIDKRIPIIDIQLDKIDSKSIAQFIALWHMVVFYLGVLEGVDPLNQPEVEASKEISWQLTVKAHNSKVNNG